MDFMDMVNLVMRKLTRMVVSMVEYSLRICNCLGKQSSPKNKWQEGGGGVCERKKIDEEELQDRIILYCFWTASLLLKCCRSIHGKE